MKKLLALLPFVLQAPAMANINTTAQVSYQILNQAYGYMYGDSAYKSTAVLTSKEDYQHELTKRTSEGGGYVDFTQESVLLIDLGLQYSGGHDIKIKSFTDEGNYVRAHVIVVEPGAYCPVSAALTNPYAFIKVSTRKPILITEELESIPCEQPF